MTKHKIIRNSGLLAACAAIVVSGLVAIVQTGTAGDTQATADNVLVSVNGATLTQAEVDAQIRQQLARFGGQLPDEQMAAVQNQLTEQIVNNFIVQTLLEQKAAERDVVVTDDDVQQMLDQISQQIPQGMTIEDALAAQGMTLDELKGRIRADQKIQKLLEQELPGAHEVSEAEVENFYNQNMEHMQQPETVRASHILVAVDQDASDEVKAEKRKAAEAIREELEAGADFAEMAQQKSECPSAQRGGDLDEFPRGQMVPEFDQAAFTQDVGTIGPVVETQFGFHIIKVLAHNEAKTLSLQETNQDIKAHLEQQKRQSALHEYIETLRDEAEIVMPQTAVIAE